MTETVPAEENPKALNKAIATSFRVLAVREHSEKQLRIKLQKKAYDQDIISSCIEFLRNENWLSDERFCNSFIRSRVEKGQGLQRILFELKQQNIRDSIIQEQLEYENIDWQQVCDRVLAKKISQSTKTCIVAAKALTKERKRIESFLQYRGFTADEIKLAIRRL